MISYKTMQPKLKLSAILFISLVVFLQIQPITSKAYNAEEAKGWESGLRERMQHLKCEKCGSNKITCGFRGKPYYAYVQWTEEKSKELGFKIVNFGGCTEETPDQCSECNHQQAQFDWKNQNILKDQKEILANLNGDD